MTKDKYTITTELVPPMFSSKDDNIIVSIDNLSKNHAKRLDELNKDIKELNSMLKDALSGNITYKEIDDKVKALQKERLGLKKNILEVASNKGIAARLVDLRAEKKDKQLALSDYLLELERMTGANQLELFDGAVYEIKKTAKLTKKARMR